MEKLLFSTPSQVWEEGLPVGNGKLGGMLFGSPRDTYLQCNEDSLWHGGPRDPNSQASKLNLPKIRTVNLREN